MASRNDLVLSQNQFILRINTTKKDYQNSNALIRMSDYTSLLNGRAVFSKGFTHPDEKGPDYTVYQNFVNAIKNKDQPAINAINNDRKKLVDSYCVCDYELFGLYKSSFQIENAPAPLSEKQAAELIEVYNQVLVRDVPFSEWSSSSTITDVLTSLNLVKSALGGPTQGGNITVDTLFRGPTTGDLIGPYVSQFFYYPITMGAITIEQKYVSPAPTNFMNSVASYLNMWNGGNPVISPELTGPTRYILTPRDAANYIHLDQIWQPHYMAAVILLNQKIPFSYTCPDRQGGKFINLGVNDLYQIMTDACKLSMSATWMYKWCQLGYRPEEMAYQVHLKKTEGTGLDFPSSLLDNPVLQKIYDLSQNYLLPQAYPEGCPPHPSYPSGHATIGGAMGTILKAFFDCTKTIAAKGPNADGSALVDLGYSLNVGDELDKLISNTGVFRNFAGIHYRSDADEGSLIGEKIAIQILEEYVNRYRDKVLFTLKKRDGTTIQIKNY